MQKSFIIIIFGIVALLGGGILLTLFQNSEIQNQISTEQSSEENQVEPEQDVQEEKELAFFNIELSRSENDEQRNDAFYSIIDLKGNSTDPSNLIFLEGVTNPGFNWVLSPDKTQIAQFSDTSVYITDTKDFSWSQIAKFDLEEGSRISGITIGNNNSKVIIKIATPPILTPEEKQQEVVFKPAIYELYLVDVETGQREQINTENIDIDIALRLSVYDEATQSLYYYNIANGAFIVGFGKLNTNNFEVQETAMLGLDNAEFNEEFTKAYISYENTKGKPDGIYEVNLETMQAELFFEAETLTRYFSRQNQLYIAKLIDGPGIQQSLSVVNKETKEEQIIFPEWNFGKGASNDSINISPDGSYLIMQNQNNQAGHSLYSLNGEEVDLINGNFANGKIMMGSWIYR
jgi:hypothetical protein